jgi:beta-galactosidase beta subunit
LGWRGEVENRYNGFMSFDTLENYKLNTSLAYNPPAAFKFLMDINLDDDRLFALVQDSNTKTATDGKWGAHRKYIDVQYMLDGQEFMGFANLRGLELGEFNLDKNFQALLV